MYSPQVNKNTEYDRQTDSEKCILCTIAIQGFA